MSFFQRLALGIFLVTLAVAAGYVATAPRSVAARPGMLATNMVLGAPEVIAAIDPKDLSTGPIVAVVSHGAYTYLLQNHAWLRVSRAGVQGPFGGASRGARGWIASGAGIAVADSVVYVLDRLTKSLHVFAPTGAWQRTVRLSNTSGIYDFSPERISVGRDGLIVVSGYLGGANAGWSIAFVHNDTLRIVFNRPSNVFDILIPLVKAEGSIAALSSNDYEFSDLTPSGRETRRFTRLNPPRFALDPSERAALQRYLESSPASRRPEYAPPVYIPAVAHAYARSTGTFLVAVAAGGDNVFVEEIAQDGSPMRTFMEQGVPLPVGFSDNAIVLLREEAQRTVVERYSLPGTKP